MCGRFDRHVSADAVARAMGAGDGLEESDAAAGGYNITPGRPILTAHADPASTAPRLALDHWGFHPHWAGSDAPSPINARAETVATSPYFRDAFAHRRCLIPANGWFEWQATDAGKQPWYFTAADAPLIAYAGIWTEAPDDGTDAGRSCAIITEPARGIARSVHPRMPLVLDPGCWASWLDPDLTARADIRRAVQRLDPEALEAWPVSPRVNRPSEDDPALLEPVEP
jgi:putative SOS response-associated peptidase YedK